MGKCQILLMVALLFVVSTLSNDCFKFVQQQPNVPTSSSDYLIFVQQWPPSLCNGGQCCSSSPMYFTIHGLWHRDPCLSQNGRQNGYTTISNETLLQRLHESWPDVIGGMDEDFWEYEWNKHGVCHSGLFDFQKEKYLDLSVCLKDEFDIYDQLFQKNIKPASDGDYPLAEIMKVVGDYTRGQPELSCNCAGKRKPKWNCINQRICTDGMGRETRQQLAEVRICFDTSGAVIHCPAGNCFPDDITVSFPERPHQYRDCVPSSDYSSPDDASPPDDDSPPPTCSPSSYSVQITTCSVFYTIALFFSFLCVF